ncbi:MAG: hypothetical protein EOP04_05905 [Proteobacteria bacterium]|nr:MAG: hypothetical protein EOP04_05905 [Pseudomonadota bacterium]
MKKTQILTERPRRRRFTDEQKSSILAAIAGGATLASVARSYEISQALIYNWRRAEKNSDPFVRLVPTLPESPQVSPRNLPPARICLPSGIVIEFASAITIDDIAALSASLGGRA